MWEEEQGESTEAHQTMTQTTAPVHRHRFLTYATSLQWGGGEFSIMSLELQKTEQMSHVVYLNTDHLKSPELSCYRDNLGVKRDLTAPVLSNS